MARKIRRPPEHHEDLGRWLLTYADMITLLMLFFIILYAMSNVDTAKYEQLAQALASVFNGGEFTIFDQNTTGGAGVLPGVISGQRVESRGGGKRAGTGGQSTLRTQALSSLQNLVKSGRVRVIPTDRGFAISLTSDLYFDSASADLKADMMPVLQEVSDFLARIPNSVIVEGHTDNVPPDGKKWASNWQLSAERALAVLQALQDYGVAPDRMSASAYGDTRPVQSNDTPEGRSYNRRVDIVIVEPQ
ncbi:MAG TPA: OmpA family protein [Spirochaetia bacterium]|nr:OmpA family protein [Spirochaetia bacterium]